SVVLLVLGTAVYVAGGHFRIAQLDEELARGCAAASNLLAKEIDEGADVTAAAAEAEEDFPAEGRVLAGYDAAGRRLTRPSPPGSGGLHAGSVGPAGDAPAASTVSIADGRWRVVRQRTEHKGRIFYVAGAQPLGEIDRQQAALGRALTIGIPLALVLAGAGGLLIAHRALAPVTVMARQAGLVDGLTPGFRLTVANPHDEVGTLARAF